MFRPSKAAVTTHATRFPRSAAALACSLLLAAAQPARAELQPLSEAALRAQAAQATLPPVLEALWQRLQQQAQVSSLSAESFAADLAAHGLPAGLPAALYDGRPVTRMTLQGEPFTLGMDAGALLGAPAQPGAASMGRISFNNLDARGTTLWTWGH